MKSEDVIKTRNYMLNKRYKTETCIAKWESQDYMKYLNDNLYDSAEDVYHSEKANFVKGITCIANQV